MKKIWWGYETVYRYVGRIDCVCLDAVHTWNCDKTPNLPFVRPVEFSIDSNEELLIIIIIALSVFWGIVSFYVRGEKKRKYDTVIGADFLFDSNDLFAPHGLSHTAGAWTLNQFIDQHHRFPVLETFHAPAHQKQATCSISSLAPEIRIKIEWNSNLIFDDPFWRKCLSKWRELSPECWNGSDVGFNERE